MSRAAPARNARLKAKAENEIRAKMEDKIRTEMEADGAAEADIQAEGRQMNADKPLIERKSISKRVRFEVFKRDCFTCQYCGRVPPTVMLEIDHIIPVVGGGSNDESNLVTSCFDCNRGKSDVPLNVAPESLAARAARIEEAEAQLAGYREIALAREARIERDCWDIIEILTGNRSETTHETFKAVKQFLGRLPIDEVMDAAQIASAFRTSSDRRRLRYFCGVCWRKIDPTRGQE